MKVESNGSVLLVDTMGTDLTVVNAARVSYEGNSSKFDTEKDGKLLRYLLKNGHWSPLEHASMTFLVSAPIFVARQWMRHWSWSFNEVSGRYREMKDKFYFPATWRKQAKVNKQASEGAIEHTLDIDNEFEDALSVAYTTYKRLLASGVSREQARSILPMGTFTEFYATANLRDILNFIAVRDDSHAQLEMQYLAGWVGRHVMNMFPHVWAAWQEVRGEQVRDAELAEAVRSNAGSIPAPSTILIQPHLFPETSEM